MKPGTETVGLGHYLILAGTTAEAAVIPTKAIPAGLLPSAHSQMPIHITLAMTPLIGDHPCTKTLQYTLETTADHNLVQDINQTRRPYNKIHHDPGNPTVCDTLRETPESQ